MARTSSTMLKRSNESRHPCFVPELSWKTFLAFHYRVLYWLWVCHKQFLICWNTFPPYPLGKSFYHEWVLKLINRCDFCTYRYDCVFFVFSCVDVMYHIDWFAYVELSLWPWNESNLITVMILSKYCWTQFANILLRILHLYSSKILACNFLFCSVFVFGIRVIVAS